MSGKIRITELIRELTFDFWERNRSFLIVICGAFLSVFIVQTIGVYLKLKAIYTLLLMLIAFGISYELLKKKFEY
jgi:uncharacterized protein YqhQ